MLGPFLVSAAVGVFAGLLSGTLGLGGGVVVVPALLYLFAGMGFAPDTLAQQAVATSLATIIVTSISSVRAHARLGNLRPALVGSMTPGVALGAFTGAFVAASMSGVLLMRLFGVLAIVVAVQMFLSGRRKVTEAPERLPAAPVLFGSGTVIGVIAAMFGIGGGSLTVPLLSAWRVRMQEAVATSSACGLPIALAGCFGFILAGWRLDLPAGSLGYVYLPAVVGIVVTSYPAATFGARIAHRLPATTLKRMFSAALLLIGLRLALD